MIINLLIMKQLREFRNSKIETNFETSFETLENRFYYTKPNEVSKI